MIIKKVFILIPDRVRIISTSQSALSKLHETRHKYTCPKSAAVGYDN